MNMDNLIRYQKHENVFIKEMAEQVIFLSCKSRLFQASSDEIVLKNTDGCLI